MEVHSVASSEELGETVKLVSNCQETISAAPGAAVSVFIHQHELCARQLAGQGLYLQGAYTLGRIGVKWSKTDNK